MFAFLTRWLSHAVHVYASCAVFDIELTLGTSLVWLSPRCLVLLLRHNGICHGLLMNGREKSTLPSTLPRRLRISKCLPAGLCQCLAAGHQCAAPTHTQGRRGPTCSAAAPFPSSPPESPRHREVEARRNQSHALTVNAGSCPQPCSTYIYWWPVGWLPAQHYATSS